MIQSGALPGGTHLVESDLAALLGISRGPVREALHHLVRENLVLLSPNRGAVVAEWSAHDIGDLFAVRRPLEVEAISLATERAAAACVCGLTDWLMRWRTSATAGEHRRCADYDLGFHRIIWEHAQNRFLFTALEQTIAPLQITFYLNAERFHDLIEMVNLHECIRDAIATGHAATARSVMEEHMAYALSRELRHNERDKLLRSSVLSPPAPPGTGRDRAL